MAAATVFMSVKNLPNKVPGIGNVAWFELSHGIFFKSFWTDAYFGWWFHFSIILDFRSLGGIFWGIGTNTVLTLCLLDISRWSPKFVGIT